jgi:hypothetical protein
MTILDDLRGIALVLFITILAGAIAYVGDRVGHTVGRRRLTLFGIRPRYTSTVFAVGTGMVIALTVTLAAIVASQQVKLAFFRLNTINQEIERLQNQEHALEAKVTSGHLVVPVETLMSPYTAMIPRGSTPARSYEIMRAFFLDTVRYINGAYVPLGLKPFVVKPDDYKMILERISDLRFQALVSQSNVLLLTTSSQNLYRNDVIHFAITPVPDRQIFRAKEPIAALRIPAGPNVNVQIALQVLAGDVARVAARRDMPPYFLGNVIPVETIPSVQRMQEMLGRGRGVYWMAAFAAEDVYPHTGGIPIIVTLQPAPS